MNKLLINLLGTATWNKYRHLICLFSNHVEFFLKH